MVWNKISDWAYPGYDQRVLVKWEESFRFDGRTYRQDPKYFVARYRNGHWFPENDHLTVDAGWDGGTISYDFKDEDITEWMEITE